MKALTQFFRHRQYYFMYLSFLYCIGRHVGQSLIGIKLSQAIHSITTMPNAHHIHADCKSTPPRSGIRTPQLKMPNYDTKHAASCRTVFYTSFPLESHGSIYQWKVEKHTLSKYIFSKSIILTGAKYTQYHGQEKTLTSEILLYPKSCHSKHIQFNFLKQKCRSGAPTKKIPPKVIHCFKKRTYLFKTQPASASH